ncbi:MAG: hypothetical protein A2046_08705 [Bacteroidetes bacterium GWA2_30_7]|nr:MAG: hypothetical protein A2046_08705 [Bacteroidetes bacterium GWA2_30_7]
MRFALFPAIPLQHNLNYLKMTYALSLIQQNDLKQADAIVLRKKFLGMVDHFAIFLGYDNSNYPYFVANYKDGVQHVSEKELDSFMQKLEPTRIERFVGTEVERQNAVKRALNRIDEKAYDYFANNCESFKNYVQKGINYSKQAENFNEIAGAVGIGTAVVGVAALASKSPKVAAWALGLTALATIAWAISRSDD